RLRLVGPFGTGLDAVERSGRRRLCTTMFAADRRGGRSPTRAHGLHSARARPHLRLLDRRHSSGHVRAEDGASGRRRTVLQLTDESNPIPPAIAGAISLDAYGSVSLDAGSVASRPGACEMNPTVFAMRRPVTTLMMVVALISGGALAYQRMRVDIFPSLNVPKIYV